MSRHLGREMPGRVGDTAGGERAAVYRDDPGLLQQLGTPVYAGASPPDAD